MLAGSRRVTACDRQLARPLNRSGHSGSVLSPVVRVWVIVAIIVLAIAGTTQAEEKRPSLALPSGVFAAAAAADWTSTYYALDNGCKEDNVVINRLQRHPPLLIFAGAGIDVAGMWAWNTYVGRQHPRLAKIGLYAAAGFRLYLAAKNISAVSQQRDFDRVHRPASNAGTR